MNIQLIDAPEYWAPALINGDYSDLTTDECSHVRAWLKRNRVKAVLSCDDESRFTWSYQVHYPESGARGGSVHEFTCDCAEN